MSDIINLMSNENVSAPNLKPIKMDNFIGLNDCLDKLFTDVQGKQVNNEQPQAKYTLTEIQFNKIHDAFVSLIKNGFAKSQGVFGTPNVETAISANVSISKKHSDVLSVVSHNEYSKVHNVFRTITAKYSDEKSLIIQVVDSYVEFNMHSDCATNAYAQHNAHMEVLIYQNDDNYNMLAKLLHWNTILDSSKNPNPLKTPKDFYDLEHFLM